METVPMKLILHAYEEVEARDRLKTLIHQKFKGIRIELTQCDADIFNVLCRPLNRVSVFVTFINDSNGLNRLVSKKSLFENLKVILICCGHSSGVMEASYLLGPTYTTHADSDFTDVISVLHRLDERVKRFGDFSRATPI